MAECEWAILCDYAFQDVGRKTCLIGAFDRIYTAAVPAQHHHAALVVRFAGEPSELVKFRIEIVRPSGGTIGTVNGEVKLGDTGGSEFITNIAGLPIPDFGPYAFNIYVGDDKAPKVITFTVAPPPGPAKKSTDEG